MCIEFNFKAPIKIIIQLSIFFPKKQMFSQNLRPRYILLFLIIHLYTEFASHLFLITLLSIKRIKYIKKI